MHSKGLTEDTLSVLRDGGNNGNEISNNKGNGKKRPLGIASYEDKIAQMVVKKILGAIYELRFLNCMYGFRPNRGCHEAIKEVYQRISHGKISYIVDAISKVSLTISTMIG